MTKKRAHLQEFRSFAEYRETFFPEAERQRLEKKKETKAGKEIAKAAIDEATKELEGRK